VYRVGDKRVTDSDGQHLTDTDGHDHKGRVGGISECDLIKDMVFLSAVAYQ